MKMKEKFKKVLSKILKEKSVYQKVYFGL